MMNKKVMGIALATVWVGLGVAPAPAFGDGGTLRFSGRRGDRSITVFTAPALLSAGPVDLSVLVLDAKTGRPITHLPIEVRAQRIASADSEIRARATSEAATNKLMCAARLELAEPGRWHFGVSVEGVDSSGPIGFDVEVAQPAPPWLEMSLWIAWPLVPIGLFVIVQLLPGRKPGGNIRM
jgi:hypothetical protein